MNDYYKKNLFNKNPSFSIWNGPTKPATKVWKKSVHEDFDSFVRNIKSENLQENQVVTHFLPKLTENEKQLVSVKDQQHLKVWVRQKTNHSLRNPCRFHEKTYSWFAANKNPDVNPKEMKKSKSKSKFVRGACFRQTIIFKSRCRGRKVHRNSKIIACIIVLFLFCRTFWHRESRSVIKNQSVLWKTVNDDVVFFELLCK